MAPISLERLRKTMVSRSEWWFWNSVWCGWTRNTSLYKGKLPCNIKKKNVLRRNMFLVHCILSHLWRTRENWSRIMKRLSRHIRSYTTHKTTQKLRGLHWLELSEHVIKQNNSDILNFNLENFLNFDKHAGYLGKTKTSKYFSPLWALWTVALTVSANAFVSNLSKRGVVNAKIRCVPQNRGDISIPYIKWRLITTNRV